MLDDTKNGCVADYLSTCVLICSYTRKTLHICALASLRGADAFLGFCLLPVGEVCLSFNFHDFYVSLNVSALNSISDHYFENEAMIAWWNDWKARDQRARIEKTFNHGRFSREKRTLGISS